MFKKSILVSTALGAVFLISSCEKGSDFYTIHTDEAGANAKEGDFVVLNAIIKTEKDSLLFSTYTTGRPERIPVQKPAFKGGFMDALTHFSKGDSASVYEPVDSMFKGVEQQRPAYLPKGSKVKYTVKIIDIITKDSIDRAKKKSDEESQLAMSSESSRIEDYLKQSGAGFNKMPEGYYMLKTTTTNKKQAKSGDKVKVHYTGTLLDGTKFDSSVDRGEPIEFDLGQGRVIQGWDLGIAQLKVGEKAKLLIPSNLGYGPQQSGPVIKPFSPLLFEVELVEIVK